MSKYWVPGEGPGVRGGKRLASLAKLQQGNRSARAFSYKGIHHAWISEKVETVSQTQSKRCYGGCAPEGSGECYAERSMPKRCYAGWLAAKAMRCEAVDAKAVLRKMADAKAMLYEVADAKVMLYEVANAKAVLCKVADAKAVLCEVTDAKAMLGEVADAKEMLCGVANTKATVCQKKLEIAMQSIRCPKRAARKRVSVGRPRRGRLDCGWGGAPSSRRLFRDEKAVPAILEPLGVPG